MNLLKLIFPVAITALSLVQCTHPQTTQARPTYYVHESAPVVTPRNYEAPIAADVSKVSPASRGNVSGSFSSERSTSNVSSPRKSENSIHYYTNVSGNRVQAPTYYDSPPAGACAQCGDGTYSFSQNRRGTCSRHGGVRVWLK
jgi:hypothetical protein